MASRCLQVAVRDGVSVFSGGCERWRLGVNETVEEICFRAGHGTFRTSLVEAMTFLSNDDLLTCHVTSTPVASQDVSCAIGASDVLAYVRRHTYADCRLGRESLKPTHVTLRIVACSQLCNVSRI